MFLLAGSQIGDEEGAGLVAVQGHIAASAVGRLNGHAVRIGICRDEDLRAGLLPEFFRQGKGFRILRIGVGHRREIRIRVLLLCHDVKTGEPPRCRHLHHGYAPGAVQRGVDDRHRQVQLLIRALRKRKDIGQIAAIHLLSQHGDQPPPLRLFQRDPPERVEHVKFFDPVQHPVGDFSRDLCAVLPVDLISVIFPGVMACGHIDARHRAQFPDRIGELRRGPQGGKQVHPDPVSGKNLRRQLRKFL